jgi:DNA modification methylase
MMKPKQRFEDAKEKSKVTKEEWREYTKSVWQVANVRDDLHPAMFPPEIPYRLTKLFSFWGETVLDPFGGVGTTGVACLPLGRNFIGIDTNKTYLKEAERKLKQINGAEFTLHNADSSHMQFLKDGSVQLIICSPPYWNKADYGKVKGNIGSVDNYTAFFESVKPIFEECYRVLQPGRKFCVVTAHVNQNTTDGLLTFPLEADFINVARDVGFRVVNNVIWSKDGTGGKWGSSATQRPIFGSYPYPPNFMFKNVHEYILIFKKPDKKNPTSTKAPTYEELVGTR